jgi:hypothetical protein
MARLLATHVGEPYAGTAWHECSRGRTAGIGLDARLISVFEDEVGSLEKRIATEIRQVAKGLFVLIVDKDSAAPGGVAAVDIAPAIADHPASGEVDFEFAGGAEQHARLGLAAIAVDVAPGVVAGLDAVEEQVLAEVGVHGFDHLLS